MHLLCVVRPALNERTYCMLYVLHLKTLLNLLRRLIVIVSAWHFLCTSLLYQQRYIYCFSNVLIVNRFRNVNVNAIYFPG